MTRSFALPSLWLLAAFSALGCSDDESMDPVTSSDASVDGSVRAADAGNSSVEPVIDASAGTHDAAAQPSVTPEAGQCRPKDCAEAGIECGRASDGCGGTLECGACATNGDDAGSSELESSDAGPDASVGCVPETCESLGVVCGAAQDGCGSVLGCGPCPTACSDGSLAIEATTPRTARRARSEGFSGTDDEYFELYDLPCSEASECVQFCSIRGGTEDMCAGSECSGFEDDTTCLPTTIWRNLENILFESDDPTQGVTLTVVFHPYRDTLVTDDFQLEVPEDAQITGITAEIRRAGDPLISDYSVRLVKGGELLGSERAKPEIWTDALEWITYGGPDDLWGTEWTPADLNSDAFGVALSVAYTMQSGNARAYVDQVRVTVHYQTACEP